jgi:hypothetical protein
MGLLHERAGCLTAKNGGFWPGQVHRRVETPAVLKAQAAHALPDTAAYVRAAEALLAEAAAAAPGASGRSALVFLASDDEAAVRTFHGRNNKYWANFLCLRASLFLFKWRVVWGVV